MRRLAFIASAFALVLAAGAIVFALSYHPSDSSTAGKAGSSLGAVNASSSLNVGQRVPLAFHLARLGGGRAIDLATVVAGHPAVINVFASWCTACAAELDAFGQVSKTTPAARAIFVGIDTNDPGQNKALSMLEAAHADYPVGIDSPNLGLASAYGIDNLPTTLFVDSSGRLVRAVLGLETASQLRSEIARLS